MAHARSTTTRAAMPFGAKSRDAEDYYEFLPSDDDLSGDEREDAVSGVPAPATNGSIASPNHEDVTMTIPSVASTTTTAGPSRSSSAIFTPIGVFGAAGGSAYGSDVKTETAAHVPLELVASGAVILTGHGGKQLKVSPESLAEHASRKSQLESALDALAEKQTASDTAASLGLSSAAGEAPFRFRPQRESNRDVTMATVSAEPDKGRYGGTKEKKSKKSAADGENGEDDLDPLYDDNMDDVDEKWVQRNFLCMDCQRHTAYTNQYRSHVGINCRIKNDEILTYTRDTATTSTLPFQKRLNMAATRTNAKGESFSLLGPDEFHPVACSDCGTTVGVYDRQQQYHFFNVLPSNS